MAFSQQIESDVVDYQGTIDAQIFELPQGVPVTSRIIRNTQKWGVKVDWEMHGNLAVFLDAEFRLQLFLESMGPGTEYALPLAGPVVVATLSVPNTPVGGVATRTYTKNIEIDPAVTTVDVGTYKVVTALQLYEKSSNNPTPIAGFVEGPIIQIFQPGP